MASIIVCLKEGEFTWSSDASKAFDKIKKRMFSALVICLPDFFKIFEVVCDASGIDIGGVLTQGGHPVAYFSEKLKETKLCCSTYDKEFYAIIQALHYYCYRKNSFSFSDHKALNTSTPKRS